MKRTLICLLALLLALPLAACSPKKKEEKPITPVGTYLKGSEKFADLQSNLYDYFLNLYGFSHVETASDGTYRDTDLIAFSLIQLSYRGTDVQQGVTEQQLNAMAVKYFDQKILNFNSEHLRYDKSTLLYYPADWGSVLGDFMILKSLSVREDGLCVGVFDRAAVPQNFFENREEQQVKQDLFDNYYGVLDEVHTVTLLFREHQTKDNEYYLTIYSIVPKTEG